MSNSFRVILTLTLYSLLLATVAAFAGYHARALWPLPSERYILLREAQMLLSTHYLDELPVQIDLERGMIRGMLGELGDPYSFFLEPTSHELQTDVLTGEYGGIGAYLSRTEEGTFFLIPFEDGPAALAGIEEGDVLLAVGERLIYGETSQNEVLAMVRGPVGSIVHLTFSAREESGESFTVEIEREAFPIPSVTGYILPSDQTIGVIAISFFSEKTPEEVERAYLDLETRGAKGLVLDLRGNGGGLLDAAIDSARFFLSDGIVLTEQRREEQEVIYRVEDVGVAIDIPLCVLVDETTVSAAEVLAAALQANHRAQLVGRSTYGKGSVQVVLELSDGSSMHVTSARWQTPDGHTIEPHGLLPDIIVSSTEEGTDSIMSTAVTWLQSSIRGIDEREID